MFQRVTCPKCHQSFNAVQGQLVAPTCPECGERVAAEQPTVDIVEEVEDVLDVLPADDGPEKPAAVTEKPAAPGKLKPLARKVELPTADRPVARRRFEDEADDDRREPEKKSNTGLIVGIVLLLFVLCGGGAVGVGALFFMGRSSSATFSAVASPETGAGKFEKEMAPHQARPADPGRPFAPGDAPPVPRIPGADNWRLPPLPPRLPIAPTEMETTGATLKLPEPATGMAVGGGGRFLVLRFPTARELGIFDVSLGKLSGTLDLPESDARFAAGMTKVVVLQSSGRLVRYDLLARKADLETRHTDLGGVTAFALGHASHGPLLIATASGPRFYDLDTLRPMNLPEGNRVPVTGIQFWAGADGRVFGSSGNHHDTATYILKPMRVERYSGFGQSFNVVPGPDGSHVYPGGMGVKTVHLGRAERVPHSGDGLANMSYWYMPATSGPFYFHACLGASFDATNRPEIGDLTVYAHGDAAPIVRRNRVRFFNGNDWATTQGLGLAAESLIQLIPEAKVAIALAPERDRLWVYRIDLEREMEKSGRVYFASPPPRTVRRNGTMTYRVEAKAKRGPVAYRLDAGPPGATATPDGTVTWTAPGNFDGGEAAFTVRAKDAGGREELHTFAVHVLEPSAPEPAKPVVAPPDANAIALEPAGPKPKPRPPFAAPPPVTMPTLAGAVTEKSLPATVVEVTPAAGGRLLLMRTAEQTKLLAFDVTTGAVAKELPVAAEAIVVAGGARLWLLVPSKKAFERWNLTTWAKEDEGPLPDALQQVDLVEARYAMGVASDGPLFATARTNLKTLVLDPFSWESDELKWTNWGPGKADGPNHLACTPDGSLLVGAGGGWAGFGVATFKAGKLVGVHEQRQRHPTDRAVPTADGTLILTGNGILTGDLGQVVEDKGYFFAAREKGWFVQTSQPAPNSDRIRRSRMLPKFTSKLPKTAAGRAVTLQFGRADAPQTRTPLELNDSEHVPLMPPEERYHYYPSAGVLVYVNKTFDKVVYRKVAAK